MKRLIFAFLLAQTTAVLADQAPDTPLVTGPNFQQIISDDILVTPDGGSQTTLGSALANPVINAGQVAQPYTAAQHVFKTYDGTIQFTIGLQNGAAEWWNAQGGKTGFGANFFATNGTLTGNVDGNFVAQNLGSLWFGNGSGWAVQIADPGGIATLPVVITGGTSSIPPRLSGTQNISLNGSSASTNAGSGFGAVLAYGGVMQVMAAPFGSGAVSAGAYLQMGASTADAFAHIHCLGLTNTTCYIRANGSASVIFANTVGNLANFTNSNAGTAVDNLVVQASSATQPVIVRGSTSSVGIGAPNLAANATAGFAGIPTCAAAPSATPSQTTGWAFMCFNTATHNLNIYDPVAAGWYHITATAGAL